MQVLFTLTARENAILIGIKNFFRICINYIVAIKSCSIYDIYKKCFWRKVKRYRDFKSCKVFLEFSTEKIFNANFIQVLFKTMQHSIETLKQKKMSVKFL